MWRSNDRRSAVGFCRTRLRAAFGHDRVNRSDGAADQLQEHQRPPQADDAFAGHQRGVGRHRSHPAVRRRPTPEEPFGVAAVPEADLVAGGGRVYLRLAVRLHDAAEAGLSKRQRQLDRRQHLNGRGRETADRFDGRAAVEAGQSVGPAELSRLFVDLFGRSAAANPPHDPFGAIAHAGRNNRLLVVLVQQDGRHRRELRDCGSAAGRPRPSPDRLPRRRPADGPPAHGWPTAPSSDTRRNQPLRAFGRIAPRRPIRRGRRRVHCGRREVRSWPAGFPGWKPRCRPTASGRPRQG